MTIWRFPKVYKVGVPPVIIHFNGSFPYKSSIWGYIHLWNPPISTSTESWIVSRCSSCTRTSSQPWSSLQGATWKAPLSIVSFLFDFMPLQFAVRFSLLICISIIKNYLSDITSLSSLVVSCRCSSCIVYRCLIVWVRNPSLLLVGCVKIPSFYGGTSTVFVHFLFQSPCTPFPSIFWFIRAGWTPQRSQSRKCCRSFPSKIEQWLVVKP